MKNNITTSENLAYEQFLQKIYTRYSSNINYGLERMLELLREMNNPEKTIQGIHIAGTNGKGSTSAMCEAIALADGKTTGLNTSPHLIDYRERFRVNGENINIKELMTVYEKWQHIFEKYQASFFEITTAIAFYLFNEKKVAVSVIEVGLGGRLDGTNPFNSRVSIITSISLDHKKTLGNTIEKIAFEKAGIIKENVPVVVGNIKPEALKVIKDNAANSNIYHYGCDYSVENVSFNNQGTTFDLIITSSNIPLQRKVERLTTNLIGRHQAGNAALAVIAYALYKDYLGENINIEAVREGLAKVNWMGRMQIIKSKPLTIIDCAHNEEGVENLVANLSLLYPNKKIRFVVAILRDKNFRKMITDLAKLAKKIYIAKNSSERAADAEEQAKIVKEASIPLEVGNSVVDAYQKALEQAEDEDIIVVTGSIYTVSEIIPTNTSTC